MTRSRFFSFSKKSWAEYFFPLENEDWKLFIPLFFMFCLISFCYSFLRTSKDVLVISRGGAEILSALKLYFVLPSAILFTTYYSKLCNYVKNENHVFYYALAPFAIFYFLFYTLFYPYHWEIPLESIEHFLQSLGATQGFITSSRSLLSAIAYWPFSFYYVMAELWGSAAMSLLFWQLTNSLVTLAQAKRIYAYLGIGANIGLMATGPYIHRLGIWSEHSYPKMIDALMLTFFACFTIIYFLYYYIDVHVRPGLQKIQEPLPTFVETPKEKMSWFEALYILSHSRQLLLISVLVISYGLSINLVEIVWKSQVSHYFLTNAADPMIAQSRMQEFSAHTNTVMGALSILLIFFVSSQSERFLGWTATAIMTPLTLLIMSVVFFAISFSIQFPQSWIGLQLGCGAWTDPLYIAIVVGALQNALSKAAKYSLFDPTKEKAYLPLSHDEKTKGKSAVDVLGARLGKALGALTQQFLIVFTGSLSGGFYIMGCVVITACCAWIGAAVALGRSLLKYEADLLEKDSLRTHS